MGRIKITCEQATTICTKSQYGEADLIDKIKLKIHFLFCKICRAFTKQNKYLSDVCLQISKKNKNICLSKDDKIQLKERIKELQKKV